MGAAGGPFRKKSNVVVLPVFPTSVENIIHVVCTINCTMYTQGGKQYTHVLHHNYNNCKALIQWTSIFIRVV